MSEQRLSRRERDKLRQRTEILAAAMDLFSDRGFHNVSVAEIAQRSEYAVGTIYNFFEDKEKLYAAMVLQKIRDIRDAVIAALNSDTDEIGKIRAFIRAKGEVFARNLAMFRLVHAEARATSFNIRGGIHNEITRAVKEVMGELSKVFKAGIRKKVFRNAQPAHLAAAIEGLTNAFLLAWLEDPDGQVYENNIEVIENIFFEGALRDKAV